ncbi:ARM repeat-containing protein, partial [Piedraia hortae CBS 480.64]
EADELSEGDFEGFDEDESEAAEPPAKKRRENPYVAPVTQGDQNPVAKYVPLSLGKPTTGEQEDLKQLRRQIQGQLNRLSNENMLSILQAVERIYSENPRQHVTSCLIELLMDLIINPSSLSETFVILHGAFCAAVYKVIGADFGAQLLERIVAEFAKWHLVEGEGKQLLNLVGFLSSLYSFQVVGSALVFDIMRLLLDELTETNTVLLLRLIQISGPQLRKDDPLALKTVIRLLQRNVDKAGLDNLPLRTRFMIETIHKLKDNRLKANAAGIAALVSETTTRFRKILGTLTSSRSSLRAREALNITMEDINSADKKGKWWLVGASYHDPSKMANGTVSAHEPSPNIEDDEDETPTSLPQEDDLSSLYRLAREQGMNTPVRVSIFVALVSSVNYKDAHTKLLKLNLKAKQSLEIPQVMLFCVRTENPYNPFYALVARQLCNQNRFARAFRFGLGWLVQKLQSKEGEEGEEDGEVFDLEKVMALAQFYGSLIAYEAMRVTVLKNVDFERVKGGKMGTFVELCLTRLLTKVGAKDVGRVFQNARAAPRMVSGLQTYLTRKVAKAGLGVGEKEKRRIKKQCESAVEALEAL